MRVLDRVGSCDITIYIYPPVRYAQPSNSATLAASRTCPAVPAETAGRLAFEGFHGTSPQGGGLGSHLWLLCRRTSSVLGGSAMRRVSRGLDGLNSMLRGCGGSWAAGLCPLAVVDILCTPTRESQTHCTPRGRLYDADFCWIAGDCNARALGKRQGLYNSMSPPLLAGRTCFGDSRVRDIDGLAPRGWRAKLRDVRRFPG